MTSAPINGRRARAARTRQRLIGATQRLIMRDVLRPSLRQITHVARTSTRSIQVYFGGLPGLYEAAVDDRVAAHIVSRLPREPKALALAFLLCRLPRDAA